MDKRPNISATPASDGQFGNGKNIYLIKEISEALDTFKIFKAEVEN